MAEKPVGWTVRELIAALQAVEDQDAFVRTELNNPAYGDVGSVEYYAQADQRFVLLRWAKDE